MAGDWIAIETITPRKSEVLKFAQLCGISRHEALGIIIDFWAWVDSQTVDGYVDVNVDNIASTINTQVSFLKNLIKVGWLVENADGTIFIPNAETWLSESAKARLKKNRTQKQWRKGKNVDKNVDDDVDKNVEKLDLQNHLPQNRTEENININIPIAPSSLEDKTKIGVAERIYSQYPKKVGRVAAIKAIVKALQDSKIDAVKLEEITRQYATAVSKWPQSERQFIPHPATWFNAGRYMDNPEEWKRQDKNSLPRIQEDEEPFVEYGGRN